MTQSDNMFYCSNNHCSYYVRKNSAMSMQPRSRIAQELGEYKLCIDCVSQGYYLEMGVVVLRRHPGDVARKAEVQR